MSEAQKDKKVELIEAIKKFRIDVAKFKIAYDSEGPNVEGISPKDAAERLRRFKEEFDLHNRNYEIYMRGEKLFGIPHKPNEDLEKVKKEITKLSRL